MQSETLIFCNINILLADEKVTQPTTTDVITTLVEKYITVFIFF